LNTPSIEEPRLRNVEKFQPPYRVNEFPPGFAASLGREIVYHLATKSASLEGPEWEAMFARIVGADWKPSNVGLDDIVLADCAWGAKTVKHSSPFTANRVRLISGRNALAYSYDDTSDLKNADVQELGRKILTIYNSRVWAVRKKFRHLRTVVLIKGDELTETSVFEFETVAFNPEGYTWQWNENKNLEGCDSAGRHCFTWQPHGSQFTIMETVPEDRLRVRVKKPEPLAREIVLEAVGFNSEWVQVIHGEAQLGLD
jgi:hypothetical protein